MLHPAGCSGCGDLIGAQTSQGGPAPSEWHQVTTAARLGSTPSAWSTRTGWWALAEAQRRLSLDSATTERKEGRTKPRMASACSQHWLRKGQCRANTFT